MKLHSVSSALQSSGAGAHCGDRIIGGGGGGTGGVCVCEVETVDDGPQERRPRGTT